jgi:hypothetical protein
VQLTNQACGSVHYATHTQLQSAIPAFLRRQETTCLVQAETRYADPNNRSSDCTNSRSSLRPPLCPVHDLRHSQLSIMHADTSQVNSPVNETSASGRRRYSRSFFSSLRPVIGHWVLTDVKHPQKTTVHVCTHICGYAACFPPIAVLCRSHV